MIKVTDLSYKNILADINIDFPNTGLIAIIGPNGSGKSTLIKLLAAWQKPDSGNIYINGIPLNTMKAKDRAENIGWIAQDRQITWDMSLEDFIMMGKDKFSIFSTIRNNRKKYTQKLERILLDFNLQNLRNHNIKTLSGGELSRAHQARLVMQGANIWLIDEADSALDFLQQKLFFEKLANMKSHKLIIFISHDLNYVREYADYVYLLSKGKLQEHGKAEDIFSFDILKQHFDIPEDKGIEDWLRKQQA